MLRDSKLNFNWSVEVVAPAISGIVVLIFAILCYLDYQTVAQLEEDKLTEQNKIGKLQRKQREIAKYKKQLYLFRANYDLLKTLLPDSKKVFEFYLAVDEFRKKQNISHFQAIKQQETSLKENLNRENTEEEPAGKKNKKKETPEAFTETEYIISFVGNFEQVGKLMNEIERFDRFFSISGVEIDPLSYQTPLVKTSRVTLKVLTFNYDATEEEENFEEAIAEALKGFEAKEGLTQKVTLQRELLSSNQSFVWKTREGARNILDRYQLLTLIALPGTNPKDRQQVAPLSELVSSQEKSPSSSDSQEQQEQPALEVDGHQLFEEFVSQWQKLELLAKEEKWQQLNTLLSEEEYLKKLNSFHVFFSEDKTRDPQEKKRRQILQMHQQLLEWESKIEQIQQEKKAQQLITEASEKVNLMESSYQLGMSEQNPALLQKVANLYHEIAPRLKQNRELFANYPQLQQLLKKAEQIYQQRNEHLKAQVGDILLLAKNRNLSLKDTLELFGKVQQDVYHALEIYFHRTADPFMLETIPRVILRQNIKKEQRVVAALNMLSFPREISEDTYADLVKCLRLPFPQARLLASRILITHPVPTTFRDKRLIEQFDQYLKNENYSLAVKQNLLVTMAKTRLPEALASLREKIVQDYPQEIKEQATLVLHHFPTEMTLRLYKDLLFYKAPHIQNFALQSLFRSQNKQTVPLLIEYLENLRRKDFPEVRKLYLQALQTLKRITSQNSLNRIEEWQEWLQQERSKRDELQSIIANAQSQDEITRALILARQVFFLSPSSWDFLLNQVLAGEGNLRQTAISTLKNIYRRDYTKDPIYLLAQRLENYSLSREQAEDIKNLFQFYGEVELFHKVTK